NAGNQNQPLAIGRECKSDIAEIRPQRKRDLRQLWWRKDANKRTAGIELSQRCFHFARRHWLLELEIDRGKNASGNRQQVRRKDKLAGLQRKLLQNLPGVSMIED